ncbi:TVA4 protein, partial [Alcedo cyanopectus]|nr:TVA4 protein [Ceyx cyanopectus]
FSWAVSAVRARVQQEPSAKTTEGTGVSIKCSHPDIQPFVYICWYRMLPGRSPQFLESVLRASKAVRSPAGLISVAADRQSSTLRLSGPGRGDSAVYYCALAD